jgi:MFS family permease
VDLSPFAEVLSAQDRSGLLILLAILFWFMGFYALETWLSSFGKFTLGIDAGRMAILTSGLALMFVIFALPSGLIATRYGRRRVILVGIIGLIGLFLYGLLVSNQIMLIGFSSRRLFLGFDQRELLADGVRHRRDMRIGAFTGLYYFAQYAAVAGPQVVGILIQLTGDNYRSCSPSRPFFMILAACVWSK